MGETLDYAAPTFRQPSRWLGGLANVGFAMPLLIAGAMYGEWLLAWACLGHRPRPSLDDPKYITGSNWMHAITWLALTVSPIAIIAGIVFNVAYVATCRPRARRIIARLFLLASLWVGLIALFRLDPGSVVYWWMD